MTAPDLLAAFSQLTGIRFAIGAHYQQAQAIKLCESGFTIRDLELVILWTRREMAAPRSPYKAASLSWRTLMGRHGEGDEFTCFQERLGLANEAVKRGWRPAFKLSAEPAPAVARSNRTTEQRSDPALFEAGRAAMAACKARLAGKTL